MVEVDEDGEVRSTTNLDGSEITDPSLLDMILTVDDMFDEIKDAIRGRVETLTVEWNYRYGHPKFVMIDESTMIADEDVVYEISEFEVGCDD